MDDRSKQPSSASDCRLSPVADPLWRLEENGFNLAREHEIESLAAIANGYVGSRGSLAEGSSLSDPATFIAGVFDIAPSSAIPELAAAPDWMHVSLLIDGREFRIENCCDLDHRRILDLRHGMLWRDFSCRLPGGGLLHLTGFRLASLADRHVLLQSVRLRSENHSARAHLKLVSEPAPERPDRVHLTQGTSLAGAISGGRTHVLELCTRHTGIRVALATGGRLWGDGSEPIPPRVERSGHRHVESWEVDIVAGKTYRLDRIVVIYTSRDGDGPTEAAARHLRRLLRGRFEDMVEAHARAWERRWQTADVVIRGDESAQRAVRFACYHLIGAANPEDERVSIGARALTGAAYKGHVFWDTEIFMLPFYLFTDPPSARALLAYRHHTLPAARDKARRLGYRGALYAWESADSGAETTPDHALAADGRVVKILNGEQEQHISADIAYGVWQYWLATGDEEFLLGTGAEILLETARFWASRAALEADGLYHIRTVIGPDEYHESIDDNAYTNGMAQWNLERAAETAGLLAGRRPEAWAELARRLGIDDVEPANWRAVAARMYTGFDPRTGLFEQFRGYFQLEDIDLAQYAPHTLPLDVILGRERTQHSRVLKQADVLMLIYLLWDRFAPAVREANFRYYEPRTAHGSSLSPSVHACLAARLGWLDVALRYFRQGAQIDLSDNMGNAAGGIHAAALGGLWQAVVGGFAGLRPATDGLIFAPRCPPELQAIRFPLAWRGTRLQVSVEPDLLEIASEGPTAAKVRIGAGAPVSVEPGRSVRWRPAGENWKEISP
jgi:trehalose/maltose hydrolase-like predicted phosphorylase